jgi:hypothetical protein
MTESIAETLNEIFEETYLLLDDILENPIYCHDDFDDFKEAMINFMDNVRTRDAWVKDDDEEDDDESYFEAGYHDSTAVFYPFKNDELIEKSTVLEETMNWINLLEAIVHTVKEKNYKENALNINKKISLILENL